MATLGIARAVHAPPVTDLTATMDWSHVGHEPVTLTQKGKPGTFHTTTKFCLCIFDSRLTFIIRAQKVLAATRIFWMILKYQLCAWVLGCSTNQGILRLVLQHGETMHDPNWMMALTHGHELVFKQRAPVPLSATLNIVTEGVTTPSTFPPLYISRLNKYR